MFKATIAKLTNEQLRKRNRFFLGIAIGMLCVMCFVLGMALYQISNGTDSTMTALSVPIILAPLTFIPLFASSVLSKEIIKRKELD